MAYEIELATGIVLFVFGLSYLLNAAYWSGALKKLMSEPQHTFALFLVLVVLGVIMVRGHNLWVDDWRVLVTLVGWATLLKSIILLVRPRVMESYAKWTEPAMTTWIRLGGTIWLLGGALIIYLSSAGAE